jgi:putative oxidoreductase
MNVIESVHSASALARRTAERAAFAGPTIARLAIGIVFVRTGWGKLHDLDQVVQYFAQLGIPLPEIQAPMVSAIELVGGLMVLVGLLTRVAAVPLAGTMVVAIATAQWPTLDSPVDLFGLLEFSYLALLVWLGVAGGGPLSVDRLLASRRREHARAQPIHLRQPA